MANVKISGLTAASSVVDANQFEINEAGTSKRVTAAQIKTYVGGGGGLFKGENGETGSSAGDIFRINEQTLNTSTTIDADENANATGPLAIASGVTLTVTSGGNLSIV